MHQSQMFCPSPKGRLMGQHSKRKKMRLFLRHQERKAHTQLKTTPWWRRKKRWCPEVKPCSLGAGLNVCLEEFFFAVYMYFFLLRHYSFFQINSLLYNDKISWSYKLKLHLSHSPFSNLKGRKKSENAIVKLCSWANRCCKGVWRRAGPLYCGSKPVRVGPGDSSRQVGGLSSGKWITLSF